MLVKIYREFNLGGADTITISWENRRRTFFTSRVTWFGVDIPMDFTTLEAEKISYHEDKNYRHGKCFICREWSFWFESGVIICSEREERVE